MGWMVVQKRLHWLVVRVIGSRIVLHEGKFAFDVLLALFVVAFGQTDSIRCSTATAIPVHRRLSLPIASIPTFRTRSSQSRFCPQADRNLSRNQL